MPAERRLNASLNASGQWTGPFAARIGQLFVAIDGDYDAIVTLQTSNDDGDTWRDVDRYVALRLPAVLHVNQPVQGCWYRLGIKTGEWYTGTVNVEMAQ